jgi:hypothetical protein
VDLDFDQEDGQLDHLAGEPLKQRAAIFDKPQRFDHPAGKDRPIRGNVELGRQISGSLPRGGAPQRHLDEGGRWIEPLA